MFKVVTLTICSFNKRSIALTRLCTTRADQRLKHSLVKPISCQFLAADQWRTGYSAFSTSSFQPRLNLNALKPRPGSTRKRKRVGRGSGSGHGKTSGRGHKGQKSRQGNKGLKGKGFEGGQTPFYLRVPKVGFKSPQQKNMEQPKALNLSKLLQFLKQDRFKKAEVDEQGRIILTLKTLYESNIVGRIPRGLKLLSQGYDEFVESGYKIDIEVTKASSKAIEGIEKNGGKLVSKYYSPLNMRAYLMPLRFEIIPKHARPPPRIMPYYVDSENRGYLSIEKQLEKLEREQAEEQENLSKKQQEQ